MCVSCNVALVVYKMEIKCKWKNHVYSMRYKYLQNTGASSAHERSNRHVYIGRPFLITIEALFISAQRNQLAQNFQIFIILFLTHYRHIGYRLFVCCFGRCIKFSPEQYKHTGTPICKFLFFFYLFIYLFLVLF